MSQKLLILTIGIGVFLSLFFYTRLLKEKRKNFIHRTVLSTEDSIFDNEKPKDTGMVVSKNKRDRTEFTFSKELKAKYLKYLLINQEGNHLSIEDFYKINKDLEQRQPINKKNSKRKLYSFNISLKPVFNDIVCDKNSELWVLLYDTDTPSDYPHYKGRIAPFIEAKKFSCSDKVLSFNFKLNDKSALLSVYAYIVNNNSKAIAIGRVSYNNIPINKLLEYEGKDSLDIYFERLGSNSLLNVTMRGQEYQELKVYGLNTASYLADVDFYNDANIRIDGIARFKSFPIYSDIVLSRANNLFLLFLDLPVLEPDLEFSNSSYNTIVEFSNLVQFSAPSAFVPKLNKAFTLNSRAKLLLNLQDSSKILLFDNSNFLGGYDIPKTEYKFNFFVHQVYLPKLLVYVSEAKKPVKLDSIFIRNTDCIAKYVDSAYLFTNCKQLVPILNFTFTRDSLEYNVYYRLKPIVEKLHINILSSSRFLNISRYRPTFPSKAFLFSFNVDKMVAVPLFNGKARVSESEREFANISRDTHTGAFINNLDLGYYIVYLYKDNKLLRSRFIKVFKGINIIDN